MAEPDPNNPNPTGTPPKIEFTAEQHEAINAIVAGKVAEAARKAARDKQAEIDEFLAEEKAKQDRESLDEVERLKAEKADAEAKAAQATAEAAKVTARSNATAAFLAAKGNPTLVEDALRLVNVDAEDLAAEFTGLAERLPALFVLDAGTPPPSSLTPGTNQGVNQPTKSALERARERRERRNPQPAA